MLNEAQVVTVIVCAGARNAPLVLALEASTKFKCISFFEERSAGFYALGLAKCSGKPVAVVTTSGTAVAELLPSAIEAYYQGIPLIFVTADRPKNYRKTGAPQSIEQANLFLDYVSCALDWDQDTNDFSCIWNSKKPLHLNVCFDEPLLDDVSSGFILQKDLLKQKDSADLIQKSVIDDIQVSAPLIILGQIEKENFNAVLEWLNQNSAVVYAESLSQLKGNKILSERIIVSGDEVVKKLFQDGICKSVIRIGGVPTLRFWRDLEFKFKDVPVLNVTDLDFSGLARESKIILFKHFQKIVVKNINSNSERNFIKDFDQKRQSKKIELLNTLLDSEPGFINQLSKKIQNEPLYLGNSLPIREWDQFAEVFPGQFFYANRGANGIDGQISTYLGWSENKEKSWCLVGDLTALYDLAALGLTPQLKPNQRRIVIMNNKGGHIFKKLFDKELFLNTHQIEFEHWAKMWGWDYLKINSNECFLKLKNLNSTNLVIELQPNESETEQFWKAWDDECKKP